MYPHPPPAPPPEEIRNLRELLAYWRAHPGEVIISATMGAIIGAFFFLL